jgi:hypothetical protein
MADRQGSWPAAAPPPAGYLPPHYPPETPSGLLPAAPPRPIYREPHPVTSLPVLSGLCAATLWFVVFGSLGHDLASYVWWTLLAAVSAWLVAGLLALIGDRGVATGIAAVSGLGLAVAMAFVALRWVDTWDWPLW